MTTTGQSYLSKMVMKRDTMPFLKQLFTLGLVVGTLFVRWNGEKCLIRGEDLFENKWLLKSTVSVAVIEAVFLMLAFRLENNGALSEYSEGLILFTILHLSSSGLMKYYDTIPLKEKGSDFSAALMLVMLILSSIILKGSTRYTNSIVTPALVTVGSFFISFGMSYKFNITRLEYLELTATFLTVLKLICLKQFIEQNIRVTLRTSSVVVCFIITLTCGPILELLDHSNLGLFVIVSSVSGLSSMFVLYLLYCFVLPLKTTFETTLLFMTSFLLHQMMQSVYINLIFVLFGLCILIGCSVWDWNRKQPDDTNMPFKDVAVHRNELYTRIEFILFIGGVIAIFLYILPPQVSKRDLDNLSYVGLDKIVRKLLHQEQLNHATTV